MKLECQKYLFSIDEHIHYLNCAYKAPLLKSAEKAAIDELISHRTPTNIQPNDFFEDTEKVKALFAKIVKSTPSDIALIPSSSYGFASVLNNVTAKKGGHAITIENEFPSGYFSLVRWCHENNNTLKVIKSNTENDQHIGQSWNQNILEAITEKTSVVLISSIHWMSGTKFKLAEIGAKCKEVGAVFIVDGTQSVGVLDIDVHQCKIDALICATYKWLFGPYSISLAYIGQQFAEGKPLEESWINRKNSKDFSALTQYEDKYHRGAARYNVGQTSSFILMPMLKAALEQILEWQPIRIEAYCRELIQPLKEYLSTLDILFESDEYFSSHLFSLQLPQKINTETLKQRLNENHIYISLRGEHLRVSVNVFNDKEDIEKLVEVIESCLS